MSLADWDFTKTDFSKFLKGSASKSSRPEEPVFGVDERHDHKALQTNVVYKVNRQAINLQKMEILKKRVAECVRTEGVNYLDTCDELIKRFQASVRVYQHFNVGDTTRRRNVGNVYGQQTSHDEA